MGQGVGAGGDQDHLKAALVEQIANHHLIDGVILGDQQPKTRKGRRQGRVWRSDSERLHGDVVRVGDRAREPEAEPEAAAPVGLGLERQSATHQGD